MRSKMVRLVITCLFFALLLISAHSQEAGFHDLSFTGKDYLYSISDKKTSTDMAVFYSLDTKENRFAYSGVLHGNNAFTGKRDSDSKNIFGMYITLGMGKLRYNISGSPQYTFDYEYIKGGGISLEIPLPSLNERFSVYNELSFSTFEANSKLHYNDTSVGNTGNNYYDIDLTFSPNTVTLSNIIRYTLTPGEFKYYVALGIYNSFVVSSTNFKKTVHYVNGETSTYNEQAFPDQNVHGLMLLACTGFSYRNIGLEIRFDPGHNYSGKLNYAVYMPSFIAQFHVRFNPK